MEIRPSEGATWDHNNDSSNNTETTPSVEYEDSSIALALVAFQNSIYCTRYSVTWTYIIAADSNTGQEQQKKRRKDSNSLPIRNLPCLYTLLS